MTEGQTPLGSMFSVIGHSVIGHRCSDGRALLTANEETKSSKIRTSRRSETGEDPDVPEDSRRRDLRTTVPSLVRQASRAAVVDPSFTGGCAREPGRREDSEVTNIPEHRRRWDLRDGSSAPYRLRPALEGGDDGVGVVHAAAPGAAADGLEGGPEAGVVGQLGVG